MSGMMTEYGRDFQRYLLGELYTNGWRSEWRIKLERDMAEAAAKPRPYVKAPQIQERKVRTQPAKRKPTREYFKRECTVCGTKIRNENKTGRCGSHKLAKRSPAQNDYQCGACGDPIRKTAFGVCKPCFIKYRRRIQQAEVRVCAEPGCSYSLNKNTIYTKCRKHSRADRTAREVLRQRRVRAELKEAA